jgi:hypothetical protein
MSTITFILLLHVTFNTRVIFDTILSRSCSSSKSRLLYDRRIEVQVLYGALYSISEKRNHSKRDRE